MGKEEIDDKFPAKSHELILIHSSQRQCCALSVEVHPFSRVSEYLYPANGQIMIRS